MQDTLNFTERIGLDDRETLRAKGVVPPFDAGAPVVRDGFRFRRHASFARFVECPVAG